MSFAACLSTKTKGQPEEGALPLFELCMPSAVHVLHDTRLSFTITEQCSSEDVLERVVVSDTGDGVLFPALPLNLLGSQGDFKFKSTNIR